MDRKTLMLFVVVASMWLCLPVIAMADSMIFGTLLGMSTDIARYWLASAVELLCMTVGIVIGKVTS